MKPRTSLLKGAVVVFAFAFILAVPAVLGFADGVGDGNREASEGGVCHVILASGTSIEMSASKLSPQVGEPVTVNVRVTPASLGADKRVGVFLLRELQASASQPSEDGWTILNDPNGGGNNYVEIAATAAGQPLDFVWSLQSPDAPGTYRLTSRVHHGPESLYVNSSVALTFSVSPPIGGAPAIQHSTPLNQRTNDPIRIEAALANTTSATLSWKTSEMATSLELSLTNTSVASGTWGWVYEAELPAQADETTIAYTIAATGPVGTVEYTYNMAVTNPPPVPVPEKYLTEWVLTVAAHVTLAAGAGMILVMVVTKDLRRGG